MVKNQVRPIDLIEINESTRETHEEPEVESSSSLEGKQKLPKRSYALVILNTQSPMPKTFTYFQLDDDEVANSIVMYVSIMSGPLLSLVCGIFLCLVPIKNVMENPGFWYEDQVCRFMAAIPILIVLNLIRGEYYSNFRFEQKWSTYVLYVGIGSVVYVVSIITYYVIWTHYYGYYQPMPLNQHLAGSILLMVINATLWTRYVILFHMYSLKIIQEYVKLHKFSYLRLPKNTRLQNNFKTRYTWHFVQIVFAFLFFGFGYAALGATFVKVPKKYQWFLAFICPFFKEIGCRTFLFIVHKAAGNEESKATKYLPLHYSGTKHVIFLAIIVGGVATPTTTYCIIAADFLENIYYGWRIVRKYKTNMTVNLEGT